MSAPVPGPDARQRTIDVLCDAFARDEMDLAEFERRVEAVHAAASSPELERLLADLPSATSAVAPADDLAVRRPATARPDTVRQRDFVIGVMGGAERRGQWHPARKILAVGIMGGATLDFREAILAPGVTEVQVFAWWGGVEVIVPPGVRVDCSGIGIMGGFDEEHGDPHPYDADAPVVRVTGVAIMGGVGVEVRQPGESSRDARRRRKARLRRLREARKRIGRGDDAR